MARVVLAALAVVALAPASALARETPAAWSNYSHAYRSPAAVRLVVVHATEESFAGTVRWFRNPRARVSAHYVIGREGELAQMVPDDRVAWHAGNAWVNAHSIGIEHEGYTGIEGTFTDAEYRASARLVAALLRRYRLPADRAHVIGHSQVPDPFHPGRLGGFAHHTDPGRFWSWPRYMRYVEAYRAGRTPPPPHLDVGLPGLVLGQTVSGLVPWTATPAGEPVARVEFLVDGVVRDTRTEPPYVFGGLGWDSSWDTNGRHVLTVRAVGVDGRIALASVVVRSENAPPPAPVVGPIGVESGQTVSGVVALQPELGGGPAARVELWIDGALVQTSTAAPWPLVWDATAASPGEHTLAVRAVGPRGAASATIAVVTVAPAPAPTPAP